jgi:hypothetical protein
MPTIKVEGLGKRIRLDQARTLLFRRELARVKRGPSAVGVPPGIAPDCTIRVREGKRERVYKIYGRAVIRDVKTDRTWQFYFGLMLLEWLRLAP